MKKEKTDSGTLSRRDFLIKLGKGAMLAITGYFAFGAIKSVIDDNPGNASDKPKLSGRIRKDYENGQMVLSGDNVKCRMNKTGERIVEMLDGRSTLSHISARISDYYSIEHTDELEVSIAQFLCLLGAQGFLSSPFYVIMYENYEV